MDKKVEELSKGMAQKLQFITTIIHSPELLILDEPFFRVRPGQHRTGQRHYPGDEKPGITIIFPLT